MKMILELGASCSLRICVVFSVVAGHELWL